MSDTKELVERLRDTHLLTEDMNRIGELSYQESNLGDEAAATIEAQAKEIEDARVALRELWIATVWGGGKGACYGFNKRAFRKAGVSL